jgi:hypothetical protein
MGAFNIFGKLMMFEAISIESFIVFTTCCELSKILDYEHIEKQR